VVAPGRAVANRYALGAVALVAALQVLAIQWSPLSSLLGTSPLTLRDWVVALALAALPAAVGQGIKAYRIPRRSESLS
jgi:hypothetical protein